MAASEYNESVQMKLESLEEMSRKLRRERIKLERNMSGGAGATEPPHTTENDQDHVQPTESEQKTECEVSDLTRADVDAQDLTPDGYVNCEEKKEDDVQNQDAREHNSANIDSPVQTQQSVKVTKYCKSQQPKSVLEAPRSADVDYTPATMLAKDRIKLPSQLPPRSISSNQKGKVWNATVRQAMKQKYDKSKSIQWKPRVQTNDLWLIRQTPRITGSYPDDEVSVYPDTISVMSVDTQVRSNLVTVEEVINEDGRTCYVI